MRALLLWIHLLSAAFWVGGMAAFHVAVRPAALSTLSAPLRLAFLTAALHRFLRGVAVAIVLLLASGLAMVAQEGELRWNVAAMTGLALVMMAIFGHIYFASQPRLQRCVTAAEWPLAAAALDRVRRMVTVNLALGVLVFAVALLDR